MTRKNWEIPSTTFLVALHHTQLWICEWVVDIQIAPKTLLPSTPQRGNSYTTKILRELCFWSYLPSIMDPLRHTIIYIAWPSKKLKQHQFSPQTLGIHTARGWRGLGSLRDLINSTSCGCEDLEKLGKQITTSYSNSDLENVQVTNEDFLEETRSTSKSWFGRRRMTILCTYVNLKE